MTAREAEAGRVLVVEDDESTALFVTLVLTRHGFDASWVMDAEQASTRLEHEPFDVLLADCRLPGQSGVDLARATRLAQPGMGIAVMTSYAEPDTELTARSSGADDFFEKPLHSSNLVTRIGALVSRSRSGETHQSDSPPARGAFAQAEPVDPAQEVASLGAATSGPEYVAESGPEKQAEPRDSDLAQQDARWSGGPHRFEGASDVGQARSSAQSHEVEGEVSGCEERQRGHVGGRSGRIDHDLHAEVFPPALAASLPPSVVPPVFMWASAAPAAPITSALGPVGEPGTGPDWSTRA